MKFLKNTLSLVFLLVLVACDPVGPNQVHIMVFNDSKQAENSLKPIAVSATYSKSNGMSHLNASANKSSTSDKGQILEIEKSIFGEKVPMTSLTVQMLYGPEVLTLSNTELDLIRDIKETGGYLLITLEPEVSFIVRPADPQ